MDPVLSVVIAGCSATSTEMLMQSPHRMLNQQTGLDRTAQTKVSVPANILAGPSLCGEMTHTHAAQRMPATPFPTKMHLSFLNLRHQGSRRSIFSRQPMSCLPVPRAPCRCAVVEPNIQVCAGTASTRSLPRPG
ncbi:hypothetical protein GQ600_24176 [Phytophthora cactorum]|nr:hypothetical protein GQ600_24176 [Phytophthora cactorum]